MFKLFSKDRNTETNVAESRVNLKGKTSNELIEEIHETFYSEVDRLLASSKILNSLDTEKEELILKQEKLKSLGFSNTQEIKEAKTELERLKALDDENLIKNDLVEAITYFSFKYPQYKFITEDSVKKICEKYNLIYSEVKNYIGKVPDSNIEQMQNFKIQDEDDCYDYKVRAYSMWSRDFGKTHKSHKDYLMFLKDGETRMSSDFREYYEKCSLEICAPIKDFDTDKMEIKDFKLSKIEIPDPVVLKPIFFKGIKHYLIVTAWGIEASDELVRNENHN